MPGHPQAKRAGTMNRAAAAGRAETSSLVRLPVRNVGASSKREGGHLARALLDCWASAACGRHKHRVIAHHPRRIHAGWLTCVGSTCHVLVACIPGGCPWKGCEASASIMLMQQVLHDAVANGGSLPISARTSFTQIFVYIHK